MTKRRSFDKVKVVATSQDYGTASVPPDVRCRHCGERIGVYEMMVVLSGDDVQHTSRAADPQFDATGEGTVLHVACYDGPSGT